MKGISYPIEQTCATDGLCGIACPVGIDTGKLVKELRWQQNGRFARYVATMIANHLTETTALLRGLLRLPHTLAKWVGYSTLEDVTRGLYLLGDGIFPLWTRYTPSGSKKLPALFFPTESPDAPTVVYFPTCITRSLGWAFLRIRRKRGSPFENDFGAAQSWL